MREQILEIADQQLKTGGYEHLSFAEIAKQLGTTRANVHHHFKNKEGLALVATENYIQSHFETLNSCMRQHPDDFFGFINAIQQLYVKSTKVNASHGVCVCSQLLREEDIPEKLRDLSRQHFEKIRQMIEGVVERTQQGQKMRTDISPYDLSILTLSTMMGLGQMALVSGETREFHDSLKGLLSNWAQLYRPC